MLTYGHLLERVWREKPDADMSPMRTMMAKLRAKLGEDARNPRYVFTEARVGYWMPEGEGRGWLTLPFGAMPGQGAGWQIRACPPLRNLAPPRPIPAADGVASSGSALLITRVVD